MPRSRSSPVSVDDTARRVGTRSVDEISHRGRMAISEVLDRLRRRAPYISWMFAPYSTVYLAVQAAVSRRQELEADRASARIAGRKAAYEHIAVAEVLRRAPLKWRLTLEDGRTHVLARGFLGETLGDPAEDLVRQIALRVRRPARQAD